MLHYFLQMLQICGKPATQGAVCCTFIMQQGCEAMKYKYLEIIRLLFTVFFQVSLLHLTISFPGNILLSFATFGRKCVYVLLLRLEKNTFCCVEEKQIV